MGNESKYMKIFRSLQEDIEKNVLKEGEKLPTEGKIMEVYGASRDTVRKALNLLEYNG